LPVAFWLTVLASAAVAGVVARILLELFVPDLFRSLDPTFPQNRETRWAGDFYAVIASVIGALPPLYLWRRALYRRGLRSWDDD
jgi:H+/Cl- antiporter ClcA